MNSPNRETGDILRKKVTPSVLKGIRHKDFAVLGQFCAKIIT